MRKPRIHDSKVNCLKVTLIDLHDFNTHDTELNKNVFIYFFMKIIFILGENVLLFYFRVRILKFLILISDANKFYLQV